MKSLLVLGSKPDPALPPPGSYDAVACANGSGYSAARHRLGTPRFTLMSAVLPALASGRQSLSVLTGLHTQTLYFFPRPAAKGPAWKRLARTAKELRMRPFYLKRVLRSLSYGYDRWVGMSNEEYRQLVVTLCGGDEKIQAQIMRKQPSTGLMALVVGLTREGFEQAILSGFSFELTHAYGQNPEILERGTATSRHTDTDIMLIRHLDERYGSVRTTEPAVHRRTGIPLLV